MNALTAPELLDVWEAGRARPLPERALLLLARANPHETWETLAALPIGRRDGLLLTLREWTFGSAVAGSARCAACGERVEFGFSLDDVRAETLPGDADTRTAEASGYEVVFRLPDSTDLAELHAAADHAAARRHLMGRCVLSARRNGRARPVSRLPAVVIAAIAQRMAEADPQADVHTALRCPACANSWRATFDIAAFFWSEIESWARSVLREVHLLASVYHWPEPDILALSPWRRRVYLEMAYS